MAGPMVSPDPPAPCLPSVLRSLGRQEEAEPLTGVLPVVLRGTALRPHLHPYLEGGPQMLPLPQTVTSAFSHRRVVPCYQVLGGDFPTPDSHPSSLSIPRGANDAPLIIGSGEDMSLKGTGPL